MTALLGCGMWRSFIACRGGGELLELAHSSLAMGRRVDDMSSGSAVITGSSLSRARPDVQRQCCAVLNDLEPWEHELLLWRDSDADSIDPTWAGPVIQPKWGINEDGEDSVTIDARDLFQWLERRLLDRSREFTETDLADIFVKYLSDGLHHDPTPNIAWSASPTGITGDRTIDPSAFRRASDELRELARSGVDFTMRGRTMLIGGVEIPTADLGILLTEHFTSLELSLDGLQTETESTVVGARPNRAGPPIYAIAGDVDPARGLVQVAVTESGIEDVESAQAAANSRNALLGDSPLWVSGVLDPNAPVSFDQLIPGARADLRLQFLCREVVGVFRLQEVSVRVGSDGDESVSVTFSTLGTTEETL